MKTLSLKTIDKLRFLFGDSFLEDFAFPLENLTVCDVLSRPFLEALGEKLGWDTLRPYAKRTETEQWRYYGEELLSAYWQSQEKFEEELLKLIEKK